MALTRGTYKGSAPHINGRFKTVLAQVTDEVLLPDYMSTETIRADHLTKAQSTRFAEWRDALLNQQQSPLE